MRVCLSVTAEDYLKASAYGSRFAFVSYRIGERSTLTRRNMPLQTRGGLLSISDRHAPEVGNPEELCAAVLRECGRRGCTGAVLDFEEPYRRDLGAFAGLLQRRARENGRRLYVPLPYHDAAPEAVALICTAISGGSFREYLAEQIARCGGGERVALDAARLRMDFRLPAPEGEGTPLTAEAFAELSEGKAVYFSPDLCARYFTYTRYQEAKDGYAQRGEAHFVLFDDADTLQQKLKTGEELGVPTAFLQWPEVEDLAEELKERGLF